MTLRGDVLTQRFAGSYSRNASRGSCPEGVALIADPQSRSAGVVRGVDLMLTLNRWALRGSYSRNASRGSCPEGVALIADPQSRSAGAVREVVFIAGPQSVGE